MYSMQNALPNSSFESGGSFEAGGASTGRPQIWEEEDRFFQLSEDLLAVVSAKGEFKRLNPAWERALGYSRSELMSRPFLALVHEDDRPGTLAEIERVEQAGAALISFENRCRCADGSFRWFAWSGIPVPEEQQIYCMVRDVTDRKVAQQALRCRDAILEAVGFAAERFLRSAAWEDDIADVLRRLGQAVEVSRVYLFENHRDEAGVLRTSQRFEWAAPGVTPQIHNPVLQALSFEEAGLDYWAETLSRGKAIAAPVRDLPAAEAAILAEQDVRSVAAVPIFIKGTWWGFIGFDDCRAERQWTEAELDALRVATGTLGAAILRMREEEGLRRSEERFSKAFHVSPIATAITTVREGRFISVNESFLRLLEYTRADVQHRTALELQLLVDPPRRDALIERLRKDGSYREEPLQFRTKSGQIRSVLISAVLMEIGGEECILSMLYDVTERKKAEEALGKLNETLERRVAEQTHELSEAIEQIEKEVAERKLAEAALRESEERFRGTFENAAVGIALVDAGRRFTLVNQKLCELLGYRREELLGRSASDIGYPEDEPKTNALVQHLLSTKANSFSIEKRFVRQDGRLLWAHVTGAVVRDASGAFRYLIAVIEDVSHRRDAEREREQLLRQLRTEQARLNAVMQQMPSGIFIAEAPSGRLVLSNDEARKILGHPMIPAEEIAEYVQYAVFYDDGTPYVPEAYPMARALAGEVVHQEELFYRRPDGSRIVLSTSGAPIQDPQGQIIAAVIIFHDVTERRQMEAVLHEQKEQLLRLNQTLEERVQERTAQVRRLASALTLAEQGERRRIAQVLHDHVQQLLYGIQIRTQLVRLDAASGAGEAIEAHLKGIEHLVERSVQAVRTLTVELSPPVLRGEGLRTTFEWLASQMKERHRFHVELEAASEGHLGSEDLRVLIFQLVRELLFNVVKHGGVQRARLEMCEAEDVLIIRVEDEGVGFDVDAVLGRTDRRDGFGLYSVRERLQLFGGRLDIDSAPGAGTRITIVVPAGAEAPPAGA